MEEVSLIFVGILQNFQFQTNDIIFKVSRRWMNFDILGVNLDGPFYLRTPFVGFFNYMSEKISARNFKSAIDLERNSFYSTKVLKYLRKKILPYAVLLTKVPFELIDMPIADDNTNIVETWHKIVKNDILHKARFQKLSRVIRALSENVGGKVSSFILLNFLHNYVA